MSDPSSPTKSNIGRSQLELVLKSSSAVDIHASLKILISVFENVHSYQDTNSLISLLKDPSASNSHKSIALFIHKLWRTANGAAFMESRDAIRDLLWLRAKLKIISLTLTSPAKEYRKSALSNFSDGKFVQLAYESILGRGCRASEIAHWENKMASGHLDRPAVLSLIKESATTCIRDMPIYDALSFHIMGTGQHVSQRMWNNRKVELESRAKQTDKKTEFHSRFYIKRQPRPLISAICSLYQGGKFIEQFMENITTQTCFNDYCELVIIDADSPENESKVIERYCKQHKNIVYHRINHRIGIYNAWNVAAEAARGVYLTNTNLDDLRRIDSLELQASTLDNLPFVDVVYQDFFYTSEPFLDFEAIANFGFKSALPIVTEHNMMYFNPPHNAPMWRKKLHDDIGYFDVSYKSAGDCEFWMRCLVAGKIFYKLNDPHVAYYQNPEGVSTRPDTKGLDETRRVLKTYGRRLVSENVVMPFDEFMKKISPTPIIHEWNSANRYACTQDALRAAAIRTKYGNNYGVR